MKILKEIHFQKKLLLTLSFVFLITFVFLKPFANARITRETLFYTYIIKVRSLIKKEFYRGVEDGTLVRGAYNGMRKILPGSPKLPDYKWSSFEKFYLEVSRERPQLAGKLGEAALNGMVNALNDPYSVLLTPGKLKVLRGEDGSRIGLELGARGKKVVVIAPLVGSPAEKVGIKSGDVLIAVNGRSTRNLNLYQTSMLISGSQGEKISITVQRDGKKLTFKPTFRKFKLVPIKYMILENNVGYIKIGIFNGKIFDEFMYALRVMKKKKVRGLIVDIRNNPGGDLMEALRVAARFVPRQTLVWIKKKGKDPVSRKSGSGETFPAPVVFLINEGSASASEVLAAAVSENKKAVLIGRRTFGKAVIQTVFQLTGGAKLYLTTEVYLTPNKNDIQGRGVSPDIYVGQLKQKVDPTRDPYVITAWEFLNR